ncbi:MAG: hypothetical protein JXR10_10080 [Cyclobacteriaceae bacterium]
MIEIPVYVSAVFIACVIAAFGFLYYAVKVAAGRKNRSIAPLVALIGMLSWIALHSALSLNGFFADYEALPPRLFLFVGLCLLIIIGLFATNRSRDFLARMPITTLTYVHLIRVPVEIVLWWLFLSEMVPETLTFAGMNYDILSGITAPFAGIFLVEKKRRNRLGAIIWNILALGLLITIVGMAISATPLFTSPAQGVILNLAIFEFPFTLLPLFVVPVVLFSHLISLYQLLFVKEED